MKGILCKVVLATIVAELSVGCSPVGDAGGDWFVVPDRFTNGSNDASVGTELTPVLPLTEGAVVGATRSAGGTGGSAGGAEDDAGSLPFDGDSGSSLAGDSGAESGDAGPALDAGSGADSGFDGGT